MKEKRVEIIFKDHMLITMAPETYAEDLKQEDFNLFVIGKILKQTEDRILIQMAGRTRRDTPGRVGRNQNQFFWVVKSCIAEAWELKRKKMKLPL